MENNPGTLRQQEERIERLELLVGQLQRRQSEQQQQIEELLQRQEEGQQEEKQEEKENQNGEQIQQQKSQERQQQNKRNQEKQTTEQLRKKRRQFESELTKEKQDQITLFKISNEDGLEREICTKLPIVDIVDSMGSFIPLKYKANIKKIHEKFGSYAATKRFLALATVRKLKNGWSRQLCQAITTLDLKDVKQLISLKQADLEEFYKRIGIPRNSLLHQIAGKLGSYCSTLVSPMGKDDEDSEAVPIVHPELCVSDNHFRKDRAFMNGKYKSSKEAKQPYEDSPRISFSDFTKTNADVAEVTNRHSESLRKQHDLSLFLIGAAGSGKTTMTKRMVQTCIAENKMAFLIPFAQIHKDERLSLKDLLTKFLCRLHIQGHDPSEEEIEKSFSWILTNQDKCVLIFDGLDQSSFDISNQPIEDPDINGQFFPGDLMSLLMSRKFLPNCRLILTSRPHSLAQLANAESIQPDIVVFLNDLLSNDVQKLMDHYLENGTASELMEKLRIKSPRIYQLVFNPLFLRIVAMLNNEVGCDVWGYVNTTAKLFFEVIERLQSCAHHECGLDSDDVEELNLKLAEMAFHKTMDGSVVFEQKDLEKYGLSKENVQDFLFGVMKVSSSKHNAALLVGLMMVFYFNHQSTQEFFSARFALEKLAVGEFEEFVWKLFPRLDKDKDGYVYGVREDTFANLRMFVCGIINEMNTRHLDGEKIVRKKHFFINYFCDHLREVFAKDVSRFAEEHRKQLFVDMLDFREEEVISEIRENLKDFIFWFDYSLGSPLDVAAHREGIFHFIRHFTSTLERLVLYIRGWTDGEIQRMFQSIHTSTVTIEKVDIWMESSPIPRVCDVTATLPHLTKALMLRLSGIADDDARQFCRKLEEEINNFDTTEIQTEVEVKVMCRHGLLHVVLGHGKPPQFIDSVSD